MKPAKKSAKQSRKKPVSKSKISPSTRKAIGTTVDSESAKNPVGFKAIYRIIKRIPAGKVSTYGDIALLCDERISARTVGWALNVAPEGVPWQRVVSATGWLSVGRRSLISQQLQHDLLVAEGVDFSDEFTVDLEKFRWQPRNAARKKKSK
jgi:methylated-DNA-protein-cysteine methyltransferase-like protein